MPSFTQEIAGGSSALGRAVAIARSAHAGQTDKTGRPYFEHCERVAGKVGGDVSKTIAYLHDVVEKSSDWSLSRLATEGFSREIVEAVDALSRRDTESSSEFVRRAVANPIAKPVKFADIMDNIWQTEQSGGDPRKYLEALAIARMS